MLDLWAHSPGSADVHRAPRREGRLASRKVDVAGPCSAATGGGRASMSSTPVPLAGDAWLTLSSVSIVVSMKCCLSWPAPYMDVCSWMSLRGDVRPSAEVQRLPVSIGEGGLAGNEAYL